MLESLINLGLFLINNYGLFGLFIITIVGSSPIPIPVEVIALAAVSLGAPPLETSLFTGIGSTMGGLLSYYIGRGVIRFSSFKKKYEEPMKKTEKLLKKYGSLSVFIFALTPLPYDAMALTAGAGKMNIYKFAIATLIGRLIRYTLIIYFGYNFLPIL